MSANPEGLGVHFKEVREPLLDAGVDTLPCGHHWANENPRPHVGDVLCHRCKRQLYVYDWDFYNTLPHIPEPGPSGSLQPAPQGGPS